jgi:hypothetical protein
MRDVDPVVATRAFFGMVAHYTTNAVIFGSCHIQRPHIEVVREMVDIFMGGLCKKDQNK